MTYDYKLYASMPDQWHEFMSCDKNIIYSSGWINLLKQAFNADTYYLIGKNDDIGNCLSIFRKGPFRIGYINFPIGICSDRNFFNRKSVELIGYHNITHVINCPVSSMYEGYIESGDLSAITHETVIRDLQEWDLSKAHQSTRRSVKRSSHSNLEFIFIKRRDYAERIYQLYFETIKHHGGVLRYNRSYFEELIDLSRTTETLRLTGLRDNNCLVAFLAVALHEDVAFYLHGSHDRDYNDSRPMHYLFNESINYCRHYGIDSYNFMSSPSEQSGLITFKERWGGDTNDHQLISYHTKPIYGLAYNAARKAERLLSRL